MTFEKLHEDAIIPQYQTIGSAGLDLHSIEATTLEPGERKLVDTGLRINLPKGTEGKSALALALRQSMVSLFSIPLALLTKIIKVRLKSFCIILVLVLLALRRAIESRS